MQIRPATPDDAAAVDELVQRAYAHYVDRIGRRTDNGFERVFFSKRLEP